MLWTAALTNAQIGRKVRGMSELAIFEPDPPVAPRLIAVDAQNFDPDVLDQLPQVTQVVTFEYALEHLGELADQVQRDEERIAVMRDGKPAFVMMNAEIMDWLEAHMEILMEPGGFESLKASMAEVEAGDLGVSLDELKREFGYRDETPPSEA